MGLSKLEQTKLRIMIKHKNGLAAKVNFEVAPAGLSVKARLDALACASLDCQALCRCFKSLQEAVPPPASKMPCRILQIDFSVSRRQSTTRNRHENTKVSLQKPTIPTQYYVNRQGITQLIDKCPDKYDTQIGTGRPCFYSKFR